MYRASSPLRFALGLCALIVAACSDDDDGTTTPTARAAGVPTGSGGGAGSAAAGGGGFAGGGTGGSAGGNGACDPPYPAPEVSVSTHGAVGDGTTDDTTALQAAFAAIEASGGTVAFESGRTYLVSDKLELQDASGFGIRGNGATLRVANGTPTSDHSPLSFRRCSSFAVGDLFVDGNRDHRTPEQSGGGHNIRVRGSTDFLFCRVTSDNATTDGFYVAPTDNADPNTFPADGVFEDCHADYNFRQGMSIINGRRLQIIASSFTGTIGHAPQAGVDIEPNSGSAEPGVEHILFRGCHFEGNEGYGLTMGGQATTDRLTIEDCTFRANVHGALTVRAGFALVQNNIVEEHATWVGLNLRGARAHHVVIRSNTFRNNTGTPTGDAWIYVDDDTGTNNYLLENTFEHNVDEDIANRNEANCCAAGNTMDGVLDAPVDSCGTPPSDIGYGSGP